MSNIEVEIKPEVYAAVMIVEANALLDLILGFQCLLIDDMDPVIIQLLDVVGCSYAAIEYQQTGVDKTGEFE